MRRQTQDDLKLIFLHAGGDGRCPPHSPRLLNGGVDDGAADHQKPRFTTRQPNAAPAVRYNRLCINLMRR